MMEYIEISAKTLNEAITKACIELSVSSDNLEYKVISEGSHGFLGIGSKPAVIKARKMMVEEPEVVIEPIVVEKKSSPLLFSIWIATSFIFRFLTIAWSA